ncbi:immunoglobulin superfamily member 3-like [Latimeria chalumnae]|uniref:immunoglobulin superfamily member 3-like n=1 Tax=Latimeria chalumnae TaxID=7897 RepID=UPI00313AF4E5
MEGFYLSPASLMESTFRFLTVFLVYGLCVGDRTVTIQQGLLYRTEGSHITIWCNVTGYQGSSEQNFEWSVYLSESPDREVKIISTSNPHYAYAVYDARVHNKEIYIERVSGDSVLLHITNLQLRDQGEYECYTPNTDPTYLGTYSAKMNLSVLPDTLSATMAPQTLNEVEGDSFMLNCEVSKSTSQHTHLSVAWSLQKGDQHVQIISLSRNFVLHPGSSYAQRYASGNIRLDKIGDTTYRLTIYKLQPSDQGDIYCEGNEWIQDPDKSWYIISEKQTEKTKVNIKTLAKDLKVAVVSNSTTILEGASLQFFCGVTGAQGWLSASWQFITNQKQHNNIIEMDKDGTLKLGPSYRERSSLGDIRMDRVNPYTFMLQIRNALTSDSGQYECKVTDWSMESSTNWKYIAEKLEKVSATVNPMGPGLSVSLLSRKGNLKYNESTKIKCDFSIKADGASGPVPASVTWKFKSSSSSSSSPFQEIVQITHNGNVIWGTQENFKGKTVLEKTASFATLNVKRASEKEGGKYQCSVDLWKKNSLDEWIKGATELSNTVELTVTKPGKLVLLKECKLEVNNGEKSINRKGVTDLEITCEIKSQTDPNALFAVTWFVRKTQGLTTEENQKILRMDYNNVVEFGEQLKAEGLKFKFRSERVSSHLYKLSIQQADISDSGKYHCRVEEWLMNPYNTWYQMGVKDSGATVVLIEPSEVGFQVNKTNLSLLVTENKEFQVNCNIEKDVQPEAEFSVTWFYRRQNSNRTLLKINRNLVTEYMEEDEGLRGRLWFQSAMIGKYSIQVLKAHVKDSGSYCCRIEKWALNSKNLWYKQAEDVSGWTDVNVVLPEVGFQVNKTNLSLLVTENKEFQVNCNIEKDVQPEAEFSVTWFYRRQNSNRTLLKINRNLVTEYMEEDEGLRGRLWFQSAMIGKYSIQVLKAHVKDSGSYCCRIEKWALNSKNLWYKQAEDVSGWTDVNVVLPGLKLRKYGLFKQFIEVSVILGNIC